MSTRDWALFGGRAEFTTPLVHGRNALPPWPRFEAEMRALFERRWYTNQGPLTRRLEAELAQRLGRRHVVVVSNEMIAAIMAAECLDRRGEAWISVLAPSHVVQALVWAGYAPRCFDVDGVDGEVDWAAALRNAAGDARPALVVDADPWGRGDAMPAALRAVDAPVLLDRSRTPLPAGELGGAAMVVGSLQAEQALSALEGGYVALDDDATAAKLRNIRSSYGAGAPVEVRKTSNGRMSEAQAAMALLSLETLEERHRAHAERAARWQAGLAKIPGLRRVGAAEGVYAVDAAAFGIDAPCLRRLLRAEGIEVRGHAMPDTTAYPRAAALASSLLRLPQAEAITMDEVDRAVALVAAAQRDAPRIAHGMGG